MNIKIISAFAFLILLQVRLIAQDHNEVKTLFGGGNPISTEALGFFVVPSYGIAQIDGSKASLFNLRGGVNFKDKFSLGAYFNTSLNQIRPQSETNPNVYLDYWTIGGFIEYTLFPKKVAHLTFPIYIGYGEVQMDNESGDAGIEEANFFQIEPSALLEVNIHKYVRFNLGAGYRLTEQMNYRYFNQSDISGLTGFIGLKFGLFK